MSRVQVKLKSKKKKACLLEDRLFVLYRVWNRAIGKIELAGRDGIGYTRFECIHLLANHAKRVGLPSHTLQGILSSARDAWQRCYKKISKKPRFKGKRNKLKWIPFPDPVKYPTDYRIKLPGLGLPDIISGSFRKGKYHAGEFSKGPQVVTRAYTSMHNRTPVLVKRTK